MDMRITNAYGAYSAYPVKNAPSGTQRADNGRGKAAADTFSLSTQAEDYQVARRAVASAPDIRAGLINPIQARIAAGTYNVSSRDLAAKIFQGLE